jgi:predicted nucleotidyltransferase
VAWGDYDNDGDLDILLTGRDSGSTRIAKVYQNTGSGFGEVYAGSLTAVSSSSVAWGDYDNDGDLDILLTGWDTNEIPVAKIYQNTGSGFSEVYAGSLPGVRQGSAVWGDYDNDGDLDILLTGFNDDSSSAIAKIYRNESRRCVYLPIVIK